MVAHEAVRDALEWVTVHDRFEVVEEGLAVMVEHEERLPVAPTRSDVVDPTLDELPWSPWHLARVGPLFAERRK